jgi:DNA-binding beta-propeller fold protein YncE
VFAGAVAAPVLSASAPPPAPTYTVTETVPLGEPNRWDYVVFDPSSHRVFVAHGDRVTVVDGRGGAVLGQVEGIAGGTHGIAISTATGQGFTDDGRNGLAVAFDLKTLAVKARMPVEKDADAMTLDRASGHVFVVEGDSKKVTAVDPKTNKVLVTLDGGEGLEYAVADGRGGLYVAGAEKRDVVRIDTRSNTVTAHWPIADCASPHGAAIDTAAHRLFVSCVNERLVVVDTDTGKEVAGVPIGRGTDAAAFDPKRKLVFSSNGLDGTLSVIREETPDKYVTVTTIKTAPSGRTMGIDPETGRIYIAAADTDPSPAPGGRPIPRPGTLKLLFLDPGR